MAAGKTYDQIFTTTLTTAVTSLTISSIPATYTDLVMVGFLRSDTVTYNNMNFTTVTFNGDTGSNYSVTNLYARNTGGGDTANSGRSSSQASINFGGIVTTASTSGIFSPYVMSAMNYSNATTYKTALCRISAQSNLTATDGLAVGVGLWRSTAAISSMTFTCSNSGLYTVGSSFTLYGIVAA